MSGIRSRADRNALLRKPCPAQAAERRCRAAFLPRVRAAVLIFHICREGDRPILEVQDSRQHVICRNTLPHRCGNCFFRAAEARSRRGGDPIGHDGFCRERYFRSRRILDFGPCADLIDISRRHRHIFISGVHLQIPGGWPRRKRNLCGVGKLRPAVRQVELKGYRAIVKKARQRIAVCNFCIAVHQQIPGIRRTANGHAGSLPHIIYGYGRCGRKQHGMDCGSVRHQDQMLRIWCSAREHDIRLFRCQVVKYMLRF